MNLLWTQNVIDKVQNLHKEEEVFSLENIDFGFNTSQMENLGTLNGTKHKKLQIWGSILTSQMEKLGILNDTKHTY